MQLQFVYLCPICLAIAAVFVAVEAMGSYVLADIIKGVASAVFVVLGFLGATICNDVRFARLVFFGLALGMMADILLNLRFVFEDRRGQLWFYGGIAVFMLGHLCYLAACIPYVRWLPFMLILGVVLTGLLMYWIFGQIEAKTTLKVMGIFYVGVITILNCFAVSAAFATGLAHGLVFLAGTLLFLVSDVILILYNFGPTKRFPMRVANLMLYYTAQLLIAFSLQLPL